MHLGPWSTLAWPAGLPGIGKTAVSVTCGLFFVVYRILNPSGSFKSKLGKILGLSCSSAQEGHTLPGFERVQEAFQKNFRLGRELGAQFVVFVDGVKVVDLCGTSSRNSQAGYDADSLQIVWSSSKAATSIIVAMMVEKGLLAYHEPIAKYWPEFARHGKGHITVAELMRHEAGLDILKEPIDSEITKDFTRGGDRLKHLIEDSTPEWSKDSKRCYHGVTRGHIINVLVKCVDPAGRTVGRIIKEEVAEPLGLTNFFMGLPSSHHDRVWSLVPAPNELGSLRKGLFVLKYLLGFKAQRFIAKWMGPGSFAKKRWLSKSDTFPEKPSDGPGGGNAAWFREGESPSCNVHCNARDMAKLFSVVAGGGTAHGVRLLGEETLKEALVGTPPLFDVGLAMESEFCHGGWCKNMFGVFKRTGGTHPWYGWQGWGGSLIAFNPTLGVSAAYCMTAMESTLTGDQRTGTLIASLEDALIQAGKLH